MENNKIFQKIEEYREWLSTENELADIFYHLHPDNEYGRALSEETTKILEEFNETFPLRIADGKQVLLRLEE